MFYALYMKLGLRSLHTIHSKAQFMLRISWKRLGGSKYTPNRIIALSVIILTYKYHSRSLHTLLTIASLQVWARMGQCREDMTRTKMFHIIHTIPSDKETWFKVHSNNCIFLPRASCWWSMNQVGPSEEEEKRYA